MKKFIANLLRRETRMVIILVVLIVSLFYIDMFLIILPSYRQNIMDKKLDITKELTEVGYSLLKQFVDLEEQGILSHESAQDIAKTHLRTMRYGSEMKDYYWIINTDGVGIMHPYVPEFEGVVLEDNSEEDWHFFDDAVELAMTEGEGFIRYEWQWKDDPTRLEPKVSYIKHLESWDWIIGTGLYVNDVNDEIRRIMLQAKISSGIILAIIILALIYIIHNFAENVEISRAYAMLKKTQAQLVHSEKLAGIGQLAAGIAHEINTPIQFIGDNLRFIDESVASISMILTECEKRICTPDDKLVTREDIEKLLEAKKAADIDFLIEEIPAATKQAIEGVERISTIVRAMKEFSHPGVDEKTAIDINHAIESTIIVARNEWKYFSEMVTDFDTGLPSVPCFPGEFNQAILNIIVNAAHAIRDMDREENEKGTITISTRKQADSVEIRISDTGPGIPLNIQGKIFDPFFTTKDVGKGTGQGLAITHNVIVEKHNGVITLDSGPGKGTTFIITLPLDTIGTNDTNSFRS